jgi:hypothetical protein
MNSSPSRLAVRWFQVGLPEDCKVAELVRVQMLSGSVPAEFSRIQLP